MRLEQQRVAGLEHDVADLLAQALTAARYGDDGRVVMRAEARLANALAEQRATIRNHGLDELPARARAFELEHLVGRRYQAANALQLDDGIDDADEHELVVAA